MEEPALQCVVRAALLVGVILGHRLQHEQKIRQRWHSLGQMRRAPQVHVRVWFLLTDPTMVLAHPTTAAASSELWFLALRLQQMTQLMFLIPLDDLLGPSDGAQHCETCAKDHRQSRR